jgi:hypothetical protein
MYFSSNKNINLQYCLSPHTARAQLLFRELHVSYLSFIDPERGGFGVIFPEVMLFSEGLCPEENIITEGNIAESPERRVYK